MKRIFIFLIALSFVTSWALGATYTEDALQGGMLHTHSAADITSGAFTPTADIEMGATPYSIDGGTNGLAFDPDNDGTNEVTIDGSGNITAGSITSGGVDERITGASNLEFIDFNDWGDSVIGLEGFGGTYNTDILFDLDGIGPRVYSSEGQIEVDDNFVVLDTMRVVGGRYKFDGDTGYLWQPTDGSVGVSGDLIVSGRVEGNLTVSTRTGVSILPKLFMQGTSTLTNAANTITTDFLDSTPSGEWAGSSANVTDADNIVEYKQGANGLIVGFAAACSAGDYHINALASGNQDWTADENFGFWIKPSKDLSTGDFALRIVDSVAGNTDVNFPAISAGVWTWVNIDISGVADTSKDVITDIAIVYVVDIGYVSIALDHMVKWDDADEITLTKNIQEDGMISVVAAPIASATNLAWTQKTEYTNFFIDYGSTDHLVVIGDESSNCFLMNYAWE